jgi:hypothetical protein
MGNYFVFFLIDRRQFLLNGINEILLHSQGNLCNSVLLIAAVLVARLLTPAIRQEHLPVCKILSINQA